MGGGRRPSSSSYRRLRCRSARGRMTTGAKAPHDDRDDRLLLQAAAVAAGREKGGEVADLENVSQRASLVGLLRVVGCRDLVPDVVTQIRGARAGRRDASTIV